jgi:hypothetical protein
MEIWIIAVVGEVIFLIGRHLAISNEHNFKLIKRLEQYGTVNKMRKSTEDRMVTGVAMMFIGVFLMLSPLIMWLNSCGD